MTRKRRAPSGGVAKRNAAEDRYLPRPPGVSFIVRVSTDRGGDAAGFVHCVQSGRKERFQRVDAIGPLIARRLRPSAD